MAESNLESPKRKGFKRKTCEVKDDSPEPGPSGVKMMKTSEVKQRVSFSMTELDNVYVTHSPYTKKSEAKTPCTDSAYASKGKSPAAGSSAQPSSVYGCSSGIGADISDCGSPTVHIDPTNPTKTHTENNILRRFGPRHLLQFFTRNFATLKDKANAPGMIEYLRHKSVITDEDCKIVMKEKLMRNKNEMMIKAIANSRKLNDVQTTAFVVEAFKRGNCSDLLEHFEDKIEEKAYEWPAWVNSSKDKILSHLRTYEKTILAEVDPRYVIDELVQGEVLTMTEHQFLKVMKSESRREFLLKYISRKSENALLGFCEVLRLKEYGRISDMLLHGRALNYSLTPVERQELFLKARCSSVFDYTTSDESDDSDIDTVKIELVGEGAKTLERKIFDHSQAQVDESLEEEVMEVGHQFDRMEFGSIILHLKSKSKQAKLEFLRMCKKDPEYLLSWIQTLMTRDHIEELRQRNIRRLKFSVRINWSHSQSDRCLCKLKKEHIVERFSLIEKEIKCIEGIIKTFADFEGNTEEKRNMFLETLKSRCKVDEFLRHILSGEDLYLCLLQKELIQTGQMGLLKQIITKDEEHRLPVTTEDIRRNFNFIVDEIECRHVVQILRGRKGSDAIVEKIVSQDSRKDRNKDFLDYIILMDDNETVTKFAEELERQDMQFIVSLIAPKPRKVVDKRALEAAGGAILSRVDPQDLRKTFMERREISEEDFDNICSNTSRRSRARSMLGYVASGPDSLINCFMDALYLAGYTNVVNTIQSKLGTSDVQEAIIALQKTIIDELEPRALRQIFVDREEIEEEEFDMMCKLERRKERVCTLLKNLHKGPQSKIECFMDALTINGYDDLVDMINDEADAFKDCPRIHTIKLNGNVANVIRGELEFDIKTEEMSESPFQVYLHRMLYEGESDAEESSPEDTNVQDTRDIDTARAAMTKSWIMEQQGSTKRRADDIDICLEGMPEAKRALFTEKKHIDAASTQTPSSGLLAGRCDETSDCVMSDSAMFSSGGSTGRTPSDEIKPVSCAFKEERSVTSPAGSSFKTKGNMKTQSSPNAKAPNPSNVCNCQSIPGIFYCRIRSIFTGSTCTCGNVKTKN